MLKSSNRKRPASQEEITMAMKLQVYVPAVLSSKVIQSIPPTATKKEAV